MNTVTQTGPGAAKPLALFPDLTAYFSLIKRNRMLLLVAIVAGAVVGTIYAFMARPTYRVEVIIAPTRSAESAAAASRLASQFAGLAALAGISAGPGDDVERSMAILGSAALAESFIRRNDLLPQLFESRWDAAGKRWSEEEGGQPSYWRAVEEFDEIRKVSRDLRSGIITLAVEWHDRNTAAKWANDYVALANEEMRVKAIAEADGAMKSLHGQLDRTALLEMKDIVYGLLESQVSKLTLAEARPEFAFTVLDPAIVPDEDAFVRPRRVAIALLSAVVGLVLGFAFIIVREALPRSAA